MYAQWILLKLGKRIANSYMHILLTRDHRFFEVRISQTLTQHYILGMINLADYIR